MARRNVSKAFQRDTDEITDHLLQDDGDDIPVFQREAEAYIVPLLNQVQYERQDNEYIVPLSPADLRMVLVGKTGSGKSASGNTILGRKGFESRASPKSVTKKCQIDVMSGEKTISVTDTPGVYDTELGDEAFIGELESCIYMTAPGPHVFLLVLSVGDRYNRQEKDAVKWICDNFGKEALRYAIVLFTRTDELKDTPLERYVKESDDLQNLISECEGRFHGFNNNGRNPHQVTQLQQKIEHMVERNRVRGREYYTNEMYKRAQKQIEDARKKEKAEDDKKKRNEKLKYVAVGAVTGAGVVAVAAGGIVFGVTSLLVLPGLLMGGGAATTAVGVGAGLLVNKKSENGKHDDQRKNK